jgi:3-deoxy-manno-octulosonate cytidylyltransferase (CMP-KDO synthetase)
LFTANSIMSDFKSLIIIPARFDSQRFPGKALQDIQGKTLIQRVYNQVVSSRATDVIIATDDERIYDHAKTFGANVMMTSSHHANGTSRCAAVMDELEDQDEDYDVVINVQGDEPFIAPDDINTLIDAFEAEEDVEIATLIKRIDTLDELDDSNVVKVVITDFEDDSADALYFSRAAIPYIRDEKERESAVKNNAFYKHIGLYAFAPELLPEVVHIPASPLEKLEKLEQLRWLENHFVITVLETTSESIGVDTPEDLVHVENFLKRHPEFI